MNVFCFRIERWASGPSKITMPVDGAMIDCNQRLQEVQKRHLLQRCARILGALAICRESANICNTNRVRIMPCAMCTNLEDRPAFQDIPIQIHHEMEPDFSKTPIFMPLFDVLDGNLSPCRSRSGVHNDGVNSSHDSSR